MIRVTMTSELSQQRNNAIIYFTCSRISRHWELFFQNRSHSCGGNFSKSKLIATLFALKIRYFYISHNARYLSHKILHNLCFSFLLGITAVPRETENNNYAKFEGANKVHYGRCGSGVLGGIDVVVRLYPWFKLYFLLFLGMVMYDNEFETTTTKKSKPRIKLNHHIYTL